MNKTNTAIKSMENTTYCNIAWKISGSNEILICPVLSASGPYNIAESTGLTLDSSTL
jgi:hypothetical protein